MHSFWWPSWRSLLASLSALLPTMVGSSAFAPQRPRRVAFIWPSPAAGKGSAGRGSRAEHPTKSTSRAGFAPWQSSPCAAVAAQRGAVVGGRGHGRHPRRGHSLPARAGIVSFRAAARERYHRRTGCGSDCPVAARVSKTTGAAIVLCVSSANRNRRAMKQAFSNKRVCRVAPDE